MNIVKDGENNTHHQQQKSNKCSIKQNKTNRYTEDLQTHSGWVLNHESKKNCTWKSAATWLTIDVFAVMVTPYGQSSQDLLLNSSKRTTCLKSTPWLLRIGFSLGVETVNDASDVIDRISIYSLAGILITWSRNTGHQICSDWARMRLHTWTTGRAKWKTCLANKQVNEYWSESSRSIVKPNSAFHLTGHQLDPEGNKSPSWLESRSRRRRWRRSRTRVYVQGRWRLARLGEQVAGRCWWSRITSREGTKRDSRCRWCGCRYIPIHTCKTLLGFCSNQT